MILLQIWHPSCAGAAKSHNAIGPGKNKWCLNRAPCSPQRAGNPTVFYQKEVEEISNAGNCPAYLYKAWIGVGCRLLIPHMCHFPKKISWDKESISVILRLWPGDRYSQYSLLPCGTCRQDSLVVRILLLTLIVTSFLSRSKVIVCRPPLLD